MENRKGVVIMAKPGSGKRQMQAVINKRNKETKAFSNQIYKLLVAMSTFTALMFKYIFNAFWWVIKYMFKLMHILFVYIYHGIVFLAKKAAEKFRKPKENEE